MGRSTGGHGRAARLDPVRHVPHLVVSAPWEGPTLNLSVIQSRHLSKVLRMSQGDDLTYTDGLGTMGKGVLGQHVIDRGEEETLGRPTELTVVAAPPANKDRLRFLVEKMAELGVARLRWLDTRHGRNRLASGSKMFSWVLAATEQSRGAWLMEVDPDLMTLSDLEPGSVICHPGGDDSPPDVTTVVIGPEGGFAADELATDVPKWDLGPTILRVETAAIVAVAKLSGR